MNLTGWNLVETHTDKKPARTDHIFEWEQNEPLDPSPNQPATSGAHIRVQLQVQGDEVSAFRTFIKIPETWRDRESRATLAQRLQSFGLAGGIGFVLVAVLVIFFRSLKSPEVAHVPWVLLGKLSLAMLVAGIATYFNRIPALFANYTTAWPLSTFYIILLISMLFIVAIYLSGSVLLLGLSWFFVERGFGEGPYSGLGQFGCRVFSGRILHRAFWFLGGDRPESPARALQPLATLAPLARRQRPRRKILTYSTPRLDRSRPLWPPHFSP